MNSLAPTHPTESPVRSFKRREFLPDYEQGLWQIESGAVRTYTLTEDLSPPKSIAPPAAQTHLPAARAAPNHRFHRLK